jgi:hypothetical protein
VDMDANQTPKQNESFGTAEQFWVKIRKETVPIILSLWALLNFFLVPLVPLLMLSPAVKERVQIGGSIILLVVAILSVRDWFLLRKVHSFLEASAPWFVFVLLLLSGTTLYILKLLWTTTPEVVPRSIAVTFDPAHGQVFNSWQDRYSGQTEHIRAWGTKRDPAFWDTAGRSPDEAGFSYEVDPALKPSDGASSGGFQTFYDTPADRRIFHKIAFALQSAESCGKGKADVGIRLTVDDPRYGTEYFTYELASLKAKKGTIDGSWRPFELYITEFQRVERVRNSAPLPLGLGENTINKVVFFVDSTIVKQCPQNTLLIRGITLQP